MFSRASDSFQSPDSGVLKGTSLRPGDTWPSWGQATRFLGLRRKSEKGLGVGVCQSTKGRHGGKKLWALA